MLPPSQQTNRSMNKISHFISHNWYCDVVHFLGNQLRNLMHKITRLSVLASLTNVLHHHEVKIIYKSNMTIKQSCSLICSSAHNDLIEPEMLKGWTLQYKQYGKSSDGWQINIILYIIMLTNLTNQQKYHINISQKIHIKRYAKT